MTEFCIDHTDDTDIAMRADELRPFVWSGGSVDRRLSLAVDRDQEGRKRDN